MEIDEIRSIYPGLLRKYLFENKEEEAMYSAYNLGKECFEAKIGIEEIMNIHAKSLEDVLKTVPPSEIQNIVLKSSSLLIEFTIRFGLVCQNYYDLLKQTDERIRNAFYHAGEVLTAGLDLQKMLTAILDLIENLTEAAGIGIVLLEEDITVIRTSENLDPGNILIDFLLEIKKERKPKSISDLREEKLSIKLKDGRVILSVLGLPLNFRGETRGILAIYHTHPHRYDENEITLLTSFAYQASSAIENYYLFNELTHQNRLINVLYEIDRVVSQSLDMDEMLTNTLDTVMRIMEADGGGIYLKEGEGDFLSLKAHKGITSDFAEAVRTLKIGVGVSGLAIESKKPVVLNISEYPDLDLLPLVKAEEAESLASTPFIYKGKIYGVINLLYNKQHDFSKEELDILTSIGKELGVAVENSRLFSELEMHHKMLKTIYAVESVVTRSLQLEEIFKVALRKALEVTDTEVGTVYSFDGEILQLEAFEGINSDFQKKILVRKLGEGIPGIAALSKKAITMDISEYPSPKLLPAVTKEGLVSFIGTPLLSKGSIVGALALGTKKKRIFTQDDLDVLFSIGNVIGIAVENAHLYRESRENLDKLKKAYEDLQIIDKMKDEFISNVSHELKTPLISIRGYGELLFDEKLGTLSDEQKKSLHAIIRNADRLTRLINSILFLSKLQAGKIEFRFEALDLEEILDLCVSDLKTMIDKKELIFEKDIPAISRIRGDRDRLIEVISNILDNAIKFTPRGGKIWVKAWDEDDFVHFIVSDNGIGIPMNVIPKLFSRFYQIDASTARKFRGTGLGLYLTKNIVDAFGGRIWIESEVGKGTTVHILMKIAKEDEFQSD